VRCKSCDGKIGILEERCPACGADLRVLDVRPRERQRIPAFRDVVGAGDEVPATDPRPWRAAAGAWKRLPLTPFARVRSRELDVEVESLDFVNLGLLVNGFPLVSQVRLRNEAEDALEDARILVWLAPDCGEPWEETLPFLDAGGQWSTGELTPPVDLAYLTSRREAESGHLRLEVREEERVVFSASRPLQIHAASEWICLREREWTLASYVFPNHGTVERILTRARRHLEELGYGTAFDGYQSGQPAKVRAMLCSVHAALANDYSLSYINPPASFERTGQKIFLPGDIEEYGRGTCLDLALLFAGALERAGLAPLIVLIPGHAFTAVWTRETQSKQPVHHSEAPIREAIARGDLLAIETTSCTQDVSSTQAITIAANHLEQWPMAAAVDVAAARCCGALPIPIPEVAK
jgi:hypothetical protein